MAKYSLNAPYLLLTGVLLIAVVLTAGVYRPLYQQWQSLNSDIKTAEKTLEQKRQFLAEIDSKKAQLAQLQQYENELAVILPNDDKLEDFTRIVHQAGFSSGVLVNSVINSSDAEQSEVRSARARGEKTDVPENLLPMGAQIDIQGTYAQNQAFIEALEKSPRLIEIKQINMNRGDIPTDQIQSHMVVRFYKRTVKSS